MSRIDRVRLWPGVLTAGVLAALGLGLVGCGGPATDSAGSAPAGSEMAHLVAADWAKLAAVAPVEVAPDLHQIADTTQRQADRKAGNEANHQMLPALEHYRAYVREHCPQAQKAPQNGG